MTLKYLLDKQGGFTVADTTLGITAYAYPSSSWATLARYRPLSAAQSMLAEGMSTRRFCSPHLLAESDKRNLARLATQA